jgi:sulfur carrier protein
MNVFVNGEAMDVGESAVVADAIMAVRSEPATRGIAVAVNGTVVPRSSWAETRLNDSDRVEILTAVAGG